MKGKSILTYRKDEYMVVVVVVAAGGYTNHLEKRK